MSFSDHGTQRDASVIALVCHFLFVSSVYTHIQRQKLLSSARLLSIERRRTSGRLSFASLRFILIADIYKKKEERRKKDSKIFDLEIERKRGEEERESVQCLLFSSLFVHLKE